MDISFIFVFRSIYELSPMETQGIMEFLLEDPFPNIYLLSDIEFRDRRAQFTYSMKDGKVNGLLVRLIISEFPLFWLLGDYDTCVSLAGGISEKKFIMITDSTAFLNDFKGWSDAVIYSEYVMKLEPSDAVSFYSDKVRLLAESDADALSLGLSEEAGDSDNQREKAIVMIRKNDLFGYFHDYKIVSRGIVAAKSRHGWALGGMYTLEEYRGRGYATAVMSSMVEYSSRHTDNIVLFVRDDNVPAIRSYDKIGFRPVAKRFFIDYKTGTVP